MDKNERWDSVCGRKSPEAASWYRPRLLSFLAALLLVAAAAAHARSPEKERKQKEAEDWARNLDRKSVHRLVQAHENDPLGDDAKMQRSILAVHFEPVDYVVCLDQVGFLLDRKDEAYAAIFWQVVFGSGDYFEISKGQGVEKSVYMLYGLQSGLKAYENILVRRPKLRLQELDDLVALRDAGRLPEYIASKPCGREMGRTPGDAPGKGVLPLAPLPPS